MSISCVHQILLGSIIVSHGLSEDEDLAIRHFLDLSEKETPEHIVGVEFDALSLPSQRALLQFTALSMCLPDLLLQPAG